jgi:hypothetical protein
VAPQLLFVNVLLVRQAASSVIYVQGASSSLVHVSRHLGRPVQGRQQVLLIAAGQNLKRFLAATG